MGQKEAVLRIAGVSLFCTHLVRRLQAGAQGPWRAHLQQSQGHQHPTKRYTPLLSVPPMGILLPPRDPAPQC